LQILPSSKSQIKRYKPIARKRIEVLSVCGGSSWHITFADSMDLMDTGRYGWVIKYKIMQELPSALQIKGITIPWRKVVSGKYGPSVMQFVTGQPVYANESVREARGA
jgi:hypothetical protein